MQWLCRLDAGPIWLCHADSVTDVTSDHADSSGCFQVVESVCALSTSTATHFDNDELDYSIGNDSGDWTWL